MEAKIIYLKQSSRESSETFAARMIASNEQSISSHTDDIKKWKTKLLGYSNMDEMAKIIEGHIRWIEGQIAWHKEEIVWYKQYNMKCKKGSNLIVEWKRKTPKKVQLSAKRENVGETQNVTN